MRRWPALFLLFALGLPPAAAGEDEGPPLEKLVHDFVTGGPAFGRVNLDAILARAPAFGDVLPLLREDPPGGSPGWRVRSVGAAEGQYREYHVYVPSTADREVPSALLIHLHGGVSRPATLTEREMEGYRDWWTAEAEAHRFLVVFPLGKQGAEWWTEEQAGDLEEIVRTLSREFALDRNRVFVTGFSDGGSGSYYLSMTHPTYYAGFIPLNGHPAVASRASGRNLFPLNHGMRPLYVVNTQDDPLYPARSILPYVGSMMEQGVDVRFTSYPGIGHSPDYRDEQDPLIADWMEAKVRDPLPDRVVWQTADLSMGRCSWVTILELGESPDAPEFPDVNVEMPPGRALLGIQVDREFAGPGVRVASVSGESVAEGAGLVAGDVIVRLDDEEIDGFESLRRVLGAKRHGDPIRIAWLRGEEERAADARFPPYVPEPTYARDRPSGRIDVERDGNRVEVRARGIRRYALDLSPAEFDLDREIVVVTNGRESFRGVVEPELHTLLESFSRDRDPDLLFAARLTIDLGAGEEEGRAEAAARRWLAASDAGDPEGAWDLLAPRGRALWEEARDAAAAGERTIDASHDLGGLREALGEPFPESARELWLRCWRLHPPKPRGEPGRAAVVVEGGDATVVFPRLDVKVALREVDGQWIVEADGRSRLVLLVEHSKRGREYVFLDSYDLIEKPAPRVALPYLPGDRLLPEAGETATECSVRVFRDGRLWYRGEVLERAALREELLRLADTDRDLTDPWQPSNVLLDVLADREARWRETRGILEVAADLDVRLSRARFVTWYSSSWCFRAVPATVRRRPPPGRVRLEAVDVTIDARAGEYAPGHSRAVGRLDLAGKVVLANLSGDLSTEEALRILVRIAAAGAREIRLEAEPAPDGPMLAADGAALEPTAEEAPQPVDVELPLLVLPPDGK